MFNELKRLFSKKERELRKSREVLILSDLESLEERHPELKDDVYFRDLKHQIETLYK